MARTNTNTGGGGGGGITSINGNTTAAQIIAAGTGISVVSGGGTTTISATGAPTPAWELIGNTGTTVGTNFLGTIDNQPLMFKVFNTQAGLIDNTNNRTYFGLGAGLGSTSTHIVAMGLNAGNGSLGANSIVAIGDSALSSGNTGNNNTAVGFQALLHNTSGTNNTAIGYQTLLNNLTGGSNMALGSQALRDSTGNFNTAMGIAAALGITGSDNTAIGRETLSSLIAGNFNTAIGAEADVLNTFSNATAIGAHAQARQSNTIVLGGITGINGGTDTNVVIGALNPTTQVSGVNYTSKITIAGDTTNFANYSALSFQAVDTIGASVGLARARGTQSVPVVVNSGDIISNVLSAGHDGTQFILGGSLIMRAQGTIATNTLPTDFEVWLHDANASVAAQPTIQRVIVKGDTGNVGIGTSTPSTLLHINSTTPGAFRLVDTTQGAGKVLTSDASGVGTWQTPGGSGSSWLLLGNAGTTPATITAGTGQITAGNFVGTTDFEPLTFGVGGTGADTGKTFVVGRLNYDLTASSVFFGKAAGAISTGAGNVGIGENALNANTTGIANVAMGDGALILNTIGNFNVGIGRIPLLSNTAGNHNVAIGDEALFSNTIGSDNIAIGRNTLHTTTTVDNLIAIGNSALLGNTTGTLNTAVGFQALQTNTTGNNNTAIGYRALFVNSTGTFHTAIGEEALVNNTTGLVNTAVGENALSSNTTGGFNTGVGPAVGGSNATGSFNTYLGYVAGSSADGFTNANAIGSYAFVGASDSMVLGSVAGVNGGPATIKVGIGTTTPTGRLHVKNSADTNQIVLEGSIGGNQTANINFTDVGDNTLSLVTNYSLGTQSAISFQPGTQEMMRVAQDLVHIFNPNSKTPLLRVEGQTFLNTGLLTTAPDLLIAGASSKIQMLDGGTQNAEFIYSASGDNSLQIRSNYAGGTDNTIGMYVAGVEQFAMFQGWIQSFGGQVIEVTTTNNAASPYTILKSDDLIEVDSSGGVVTVKLPINLAAGLVTGRKYSIKDSTGSSTTNNITVDGNGKNIDGAATQVLSVNYRSITVVYNGTQWSII